MFNAANEALVAVAAAQEKKRYVREQLVIMKDKCVVCNQSSCDGTAHQCLKQDRRHYCFKCQAKSVGQNYHTTRSLEPGDIVCKAADINTNQQSCPIVCDFYS